MIRKNQRERERERGRHPGGVADTPRWLYPTARLTPPSCLIKTALIKIVILTAAAGLLVSSAAAYTLHDVKAVTDIEGSTHICFSEGSYYSDLWYAEKRWDSTISRAEVIDSGGGFGDAGYDTQIQANTWGVVIAYRSGKHYGDLYVISRPRKGMKQLAIIPPLWISPWTKVKVDDGGSYLGDTGYNIKLNVDESGCTQVEYQDKRNNRTMVATSVSPSGPFTIQERK